jgi:hypothetical protein
MRKGLYGYHTTEPPATLKHVSVVSCETIRIGLFIAALNDVTSF